MPIHNCPCCRCARDEDAERAAQIAERIEAFTRRCEGLGVQVEGNRVAPRTAAELLGMKPKTFDGWRNQGIGPQAERIPVRGSQYSYDLNVLAAWSVDQKIEKKF